MTWFKVDDTLAFHRKTVAAGNAAMGLWVRAGSWAAQSLTDGFVPDHMITLMGTAAQRAKLIKVGLWTEVAGGCRFHEWNENGRQPTGESVRERRQRDAERQAKRRADFQRKRQVSESRPPVTPIGVTDGVTGGVTGAPTRPDPTRNYTQEADASCGARKRARATRLPADFAVTPDMAAWAREHTPHVDGRRETDRFIDHWRSASGANARKLDWSAAWRNWMRKADDQAPQTSIARRSVSRPATTTARVQGALAFLDPNGD